jgi:hypothetical protein
MPWIAAIPALVSAASSLFGASKQKKAQKELLNYQRSIALDPVTGKIGDIGVDNGSVYSGTFGPLQQAFSGGAGNILSGIDFSGNLPPELSAGLEQFASMLGGNQARSSFGAEAFSGAAGLMPELGQGFESTRTNMLNMLRASAAPEEERYSQNFMQGLFNRGQMGTTGGAQQTEAFARGLGQADLSRQVMAGNEARAASSDVMSRFSALAGQGAENFGAEEDFLGRLLGLRTGMAGLPGELQGQQIGNAGAMLGGASSIQGMLQQAFGSMLNKSTAATQVKLGGAGLNTQLQMAPGYSASPVADAFGNLGAGMQQPGGSLASLFGQLFSRAGSSGARSAIASGTDRFQTL